MGPTTQFFGREDELRQVGELVAQHRLVTVTGPGGIGKTRLVAEAAPALDGAFGEHVYRIELTGLDAGADAGTISAQLDVASPEALALSLREVDALVILDNCEHLLDGAASFAEQLLAVGNSIKVLATSRAPLAVPGEHLLVLEPLPSPAVGDPDPLAFPAAALFFERASARGATWERTPETMVAIGELCRQVDGLPLAIELAASRARAQSPVELLSLMERRLDVLQAADHGRPARHQSLRAAIDVSVEPLDDEALPFFQRLGVLAGHFDLDLAHAVAGPRPEDRLVTVDLIGGLVDRSLVQAEAAGTRTRYRLLELVRDHAIDGLHQSGQWDDANERLRDAMVAEADRIVEMGVQGWSGDLVGRVAANIGNFAAAIDWCIEHDATPEAAVRLFLPLFAAVHQSRSGDVRAIGERIVARWPDEPAPFRPEALAVLATAYAIAKQSERAEGLAAAALDDPLVTPIGRVIAERALVLAALGRDDPVEARRHAERGRAEAASAGMAPFERELMGFEASLLDRAGEAEPAAALAEETAAASARAGDPITEIWARLVAANIAMRAGRWAEAGIAIERAQAISRSIRDAWWGGAIFRSQAMLAAMEAAEVAISGGWEESRELWRAAIDRAARRGDLPELALTLRAAAVVAARAGRPDTADALLDAVPYSTELTVLPVLFEEERRRLEADRVVAPPAERPSIVVALQAALAAIDDHRNDEPPENRAAVDRSTPGDLREAAGGRPASAVDRSTSGELRKEADVWAITFGGQTIRMRDLKGIGDLAVLLARPAVEVHALELMGGARVDEGGTADLDDQARREYRARILELQAEIDEAQAANDPARADHAQVELDQLVEHLSAALGLGGRARATGTSAERARTAVTYRIRAAIRRIDDAHPELGRHLAHSVRTGSWCVYSPETDLHWVIEGA